MGGRGTAARNAGSSGRHKITDSTPRIPLIGPDIEAWAGGRARRPPGERGIVVVGHQQRGGGSMAMLVGAIPHEDLGGARTGHDAPLAVGMRPRPLRMGLPDGHIFSFREGLSA
jgi:hypothetical protein